LDVIAAEIIDDEWRLEVQTIATTVGCAACGSQARLHARRTVQVRDLPVGGRPVVLAWRKRIWRCGAGLCGPGLDRTANRLFATKRGCRPRSCAVR
jgi:transposase